MAFDFEQADEAANGESNTLKVPGTFHFQVVGIDENPLKKDGSHIDALKVELVALAGTVPDCAGKEFDLFLFLPNLKQKNNGEFARKRLTRFFLAIGLLQEHKPGARVSVETSEGIGRQLIAKLALDDQEPDPAKKRLGLSFADIFHVDEPHRLATECPKDLTAIAQIPAELRMDRAKFDRIYGSHGQGGTNRGQASSAALSSTSTAAASAPAPAASLDDF